MRFVAKPKTTALLLAMIYPILQRKRKCGNFFVYFYRKINAC
ncbi:hypothetical protein HifGL_001198 [Haemophilus influenzae KR494]|nr:hypothetical protein HifGL_001198 [Haemophilus influenzae KR494]